MDTEKRTECGLNSKAEVDRYYKELIGSIEDFFKSAAMVQTEAYEQRRRADEMVGKAIRIVIGSLVASSVIVIASLLLLAIAAR